MLQTVYQRQRERQWEQQQQQERIRDVRSLARIFTALAAMLLVANVLTVHSFPVLALASAGLHALTAMANLWLGPMPVLSCLVALQWVVSSALPCVLHHLGRAGWSR